MITPSKAFLRASASSLGEWLVGAVRVAIVEYVLSIVLSKKM